jgi:hypothetical protein
MAIRNDSAEPALQGRSLRAARTQCSSSEPTILQTAAVRISTALMSESGQKHELPRRSIGVRFAPNKQTPTARAQCDAMCHKRTRALQKRNLLNHLVSELLKLKWHFESERLGGLQVDHQLEFDGGLDWKLARFRALEDAIDIRRKLSIRSSP